MGAHRILVVDDNRDAAETLGMLLELKGHEVHLAYDGRTAIDAAARVRPDLILLDIGMPDLDGLEVCREIRKTLWGTETSIVALSGWGQEDDRRKTAEAGFDDHLVKPVDPTVLSNLLQALPTR